MDFGFNQEQELLRATARKFFENECTSEFVRARMVEPDGVTDEFWGKLAEQGWLGLIYPEEFGGVGLTEHATTTKPWRLFVAGSRGVSRP